MCKILFVVAAFAATLLSVSAQAEQFDRRGFPISPVEHRTGPCALGPHGCAIVDVGSPHARHHAPDYRAPFTQFRGRNYYPRGYGVGGGQYENGYRFHRWHRSSVEGVSQAPRPNPIKEKFLSDCAAQGAPVTQTGGGGMHCHRGPTITTVID
jgi:hypothetical protein